MGDDIRDRFRGARTDYTGPVRPSLRPVAQPPSQMFGQQHTAPKPAPAPNPARSNVAERPSPVAVPKQKRKKRTKKFWSKKKVFLLLPLILILAGGGTAAAFVYKKRLDAKANKPTTQAFASTTTNKVSQPAGTITLLATGDFSAYDSVNTSAKTATGYDYSRIMAPLKPVFDKFDIRFCNQATLGGGIGLGVSGYPTFNAPTEWSKGLEDLGCNLINMGTNHTSDKGQEAITAAVNYYDNHSNILATAGANRSAEEQSKIRYFTLKQVKFAYLSYTTSSLKPPSQPFGINLYNADAAKKQVADARKNAQFVIVAMNWGKEDSGDVQPEQETIAQDLTNAGADLIIGNGPHVVQPAKIMNGQDGHQSLVWFSLGNAVNSQLPSDNLFGGIGIVNIDIATQHMTDPKFLPTYMHYEWTPEQKRKPDLNARTNLMWYPLDTAKDALAKSQNGTTVEAQTERLKSIITKFAPVTVITSTNL